jgi:hypothetical protein
MMNVLPIRTITWRTSNTSFKRLAPTMVSALLSIRTLTLRSDLELFAGGIGNAQAICKTTALEGSH